MSDPISAVVGAGAGLAGASKTASASEKAAKTAAGYQPRYAKQIDAILYELMKQQAAIPFNYSEYAPIVEGFMEQYQGIQDKYKALLDQYLSGAFTPYTDEIYNTYLNRAVQGTRSGLSSRGLNTSPYGAGIEAETINEFARKWALDEQTRRERALQNYMAGQSGLMSLGTSALNTALALQQLKKGWSQSDINNMLSYIGRAAGNPSTAAQYMMMKGQIEAQPWNALAGVMSSGNLGLTDMLYGLLNRGSYQVPALSTARQNAILGGY